MPARLVAQPERIAHRVTDNGRQERRDEAAQVATGIHETILWSLGYTGFPLFIRKHPETIKKFIARLEELSMKTNMAMMDAGVQVIFCGDDMAFKTGPMMNPKIIDELFGPSYTRIAKAVHDRGGRVLVHS